MNPPRVTFQVNALAIIAVIVIVAAGVAFALDFFDNTPETDWDDEREAAARKLAAGNHALGLAVLKYSSLQKKYDTEMEEIAAEFDGLELIAERRSKIILDLQAEIEATGKATATETADGALKYRFIAPWYKFETPNVRATGGERLTIDGLSAELETLGIGIKDDGRKTEQFKIRFFDPTGETVPIHTHILDHVLETAPPEKEKSRRKRPRFALDLWGGATYPLAAFPEPSDPFDVHAQTGLDIHLWKFTFSAWGEANRTPGHSAFAEIRALVGVRYNFWQYP